MQDIEQADLNLAGEIRKLVDREDAAIGPRQQAEMHRELVRQEMPAARRLDRIDVADDVGDGDVRGRELLDEPDFARQPGDRRRVAALGDQLTSVFGDRIEGIVVDLAARDDRNLLVEQRDELAQDTTLRLAAQAEQNEVVAREDRVDELRQDGFLVPHDAREQRGAVLEQTDQVLAHFIFDRALAAGGTGPLRLLQLTECRRLCHGSTLNPSARALQPLRDAAHTCQQRPEHFVVGPPRGAPPLQQIDLE